jgi:lysozyme
MDPVTDILSQLARDEGFRPDPYKDSRGFNTVGIGHNLDANPLPDEQYPMSLDRAKQILADDLSRIWSKLQIALPWVVSLPDVYAGILKNMSFNMGANGLLQFHHMLAYIQAGNYAAAANAMQQSAWFTQVGDRAKRLVQQMQSGQWV